MPGRTIQVPVYYVGSTAAGPRLFAESHQVTDATESDLQVAVQEVLRGDPLDSDYESSLPRRDVDRPRLDRRRDDHDRPVRAALRATGDMDEERGTDGGAVARLDGRGGHPEQQPVRFTVDGEPADQVLDVDTSAPVERASADSILATVSIATPGEGATVPTRFEVTGQAATFEANVVWELKRGDEVVRNGFTTARECCTLSPYSFTVTATPGDYTLVVHDTDESDGEGIGTSEDTKRIKVE